jgi:TPR repeat protein
MRAAGQGHVRAQLRLSEIFLAGKGVPRNSIAAYKWALVAERTAQEPETLDKAAQMFNVLGPLMSRAQIAEARSLAADWRQAPELQQASNAQPTEKRVCQPAARATARTALSTPSHPQAQLARKRVEPANHIARRLRSLGRHLHAEMIWFAGQ